MDGSYQSLEALPIEHLHIVFVASSSCSEDDSPTTAAYTAAAASSAPACQQLPAVKKNSGLANGYANPAPPKLPNVKAKAKKVPGKTASASRVSGKDRERAKKEMERKARVEEDALDAPPDGWPLRRVISIEEDHLPHLLLGGPQLLLHQLSEEEDEEEAEEAQSDTESSVVSKRDLRAASPSRHVPAEAAQSRKSRLPRAKKTPASLRGQPVGKETQHVCRRL